MASPVNVSGLTQQPAAPTVTPAPTKRRFDVVYDAGSNGSRVSWWDAKSSSWTEFKAWPAASNKEDELPPKVVVEETTGNITHIGFELRGWIEKDGEKSYDNLKANFGSSPGSPEGLLFLRFVYLTVQIFTTNLLNEWRDCTHFRLTMAHPVVWDRNHLAPFESHVKNAMTSVFTREGIDMEHEVMLLHEPAAAMFGLDVQALMNTHGIKDGEFLSICDFGGETTVDILPHPGQQVLMLCAGYMYHSTNIALPGPPEQPGQPASIHTLS